MDINSFSYKKEMGETPVDYSSPADIGTPGMEDTNLSMPILEPISQGYSKEEPVMDSKRLFVISGGEDRERKYFEVFQNNVSDNVKIIFTSKTGQGLTPSQMTRVLLAAQEDKQFWDINDKEYYFGGDDEVYMIQDIDSFYDEILLARATCAEEAPTIDVHWVISNPCFEMWLYYHYFDTPCHVSTLNEIDVAKRSHWLKQHQNELHAGGFQASKCFPLTDVAIKNSQRNYYEDENDIPLLFSTDMHIMVEKIITFSSVPFEDVIALIRARARNFTRGLT